MLSQEKAALTTNLSSGHVPKGPRGRLPLKDA